jgi:hypothetical protein
MPSSVESEREKKIATSAFCTRSLVPLARKSKKNALPDDESRENKKIKSHHEVKDSGARGRQ